MRHNNRGEDDPGLFTAEAAGDQILNLELAKACQAAGAAVFDRFHYRLFTIYHEDRLRPSPAELLSFAAECGLDVDAFQADRGRWLAAVVADHEEGRDRWEVFGVPTVVFDDTNPMFLKMKTIPESVADSVALYDLYLELARRFPGVVEIKYSTWK